NAMPVEHGPFEDPLGLSLYGRVVREVLRKRGIAFAFLVASMMHAAGHAALAALGGACVRVLIGGAGLVAARSTVSPLGVGAADRALSLALLGLGAALVKGLGGVGATYAQTRIAGGVAGTLRVDLLNAWFTRYRLRYPWHPDHGVRGGCEVPTA